MTPDTAFDDQANIPAATSVPVRRYDWSGLRNWRLLIFAGFAVIFPGSCAASFSDHFSETLVIGILLAAVAVVRLGGWPCPRCSSGFARRRAFPYIRPFAGACGQCGLPEFTPDESAAPPIVHADPGPIPAKPIKRSIFKDPRARVALLIAVPLLWMTVCRLPFGSEVTLSSGRRIKVLSLVNNTQWTTSKGTTHSLVLTYYAPADTAISNDELLKLTLPAIKETGDSNVILQSLRDDWWARSFGIRISSGTAYRLQPDGTWVGR